MKKIGVAISGDNLLSPGWNRVKRSAKHWGGQWPSWPPRFRHHCIWMVELRKFEPHLKFIENSLFRNRKRKWRVFSFAEYCPRRQELTWDNLEESSNIGVMESVYLEIQCLAAFHHTWCTTPFEHYMADCYIGKAMKKHVTEFVKKHHRKSMDPEIILIELLTKIRYRLEVAWILWHPELILTLNLSKYRREYRSSRKLRSITKPSQSVFKQKRACDSAQEWCNEIFQSSWELEVRTICSLIYESLKNQWQSKSTKAALAPIINSICSGDRQTV